MADPLAQYFDQEQSDPLASFFDGPQVGKVPDVSLKTKHAANVAAGAEAYKPSWSDVWQGKAGGIGSWQGIGREMAKDVGTAITETPKRIGAAISAVPKLAMGLTTPELGVPMVGGVNLRRAGDLGAEAIKGITEPLMSPRTMGKAVAEGAIDTALLAGTGKAVGALAKAPTAWKTYQGGQVGNRIKAGLAISPTDARALSAVDESLSSLRTGTKTKVPFTNTQSMADFVGSHNRKFFKRHHEELARINESLPVEFMGERTTLDKVLAERTRLNKRLNNYQSQDPKTRAIMEEVNPSLKADVERLQAARDTINGAIDTVAPQSASQADIMRTYSHLKELEDITVSRAAELKAIKEIAKGSKLPFREAAKDFVLNKLTLGMAPGAQIPSRLMFSLRKSLSGPRVDPDKLIKIAGRKFKHVKPADSITPKPMAFPEKPLNAQEAGQADLPLAPPGVGAMGAELPNQLDPLQSSISIPNELTQKFGSPLGEAKPPDVTGQYKLPMAPPNVGGVGGELGHQIDPLQSTISMPNELTRQFRVAPIENINQTDLFGQTQLPFIAPQVGGVPQQIGGLRGTRGPTFPSTYGPPDRRAELLQNAGGQIRYGPPTQGQTVPITVEPVPSAAIGQPTVKGQQLKPYSGVERRRVDVESVQRRMAVDQARANPEVAMRAAAIKDEMDANPSPQLVDAYDALYVQHPWITDWLLSRDVRKGGTRR